MKNKALQFILAAIIMACGGAGLLWLKMHQRLGQPGLSLDLPEQALDFKSMPQEVSKIEIDTLPKDTSFGRRLYYRVREGVTNYYQVSIVLMGSDRTSIHKPQFCLVGQGWTIDRTDKSTIPMARPHAYEMPVMKLGLARKFKTEGGKEVLRHGNYTYWFVADKAVTADHWERMWWMARNLFLTGELQRWAYVSCFGTCWPGEEATLDAEMKELLTAIVPEFQKATVAPGPLAQAR